MGIKLDIYYKIDPDLRNRWLKLWNENRDAHPFNHPAWFTVAPVMHRNMTRMVFVASKNSQDVMFLSAEVCGEKLTLLGSPYLDKSSILMDPSMSKSDWKEVISYLLSDYNEITFQEAPQYLSNRLCIETSEAWVMSKRSSFSPFFEIEHPHITKKRRKEMKRCTRKLDRERGPLAIDFIPLTIELVKTMSDIEKRSTKPGRGRSEFGNKNYFNFIKNAIVQYDGMCWVGLMTLAGNSMAHLACIVYKNRVLGLHTAFDMELTQYSPGNVLIFNILPILSGMGIEAFEFGRGQSVLKSRFSGGKMEAQDSVYFFKKNVRGTIGMLQTELLWGGISLGRWIRAKNLRIVNRVLDRLAIKR